ncbi:MAG: BREX system ATP-binding domain-containing protein, partial [Candidatus Eremiobacterota bacterium]
LDLVIKWFAGAKVLLREIRTVGIGTRVERNNAIEYMGEVCKMINHLGYKGIIILIDEDERNSTVAEDKTMESFRNLSYIRNRLIRFPHIYILYSASPDFYKLLKPEGNITEEEGFSNIAQLIDIPIEFMDKNASMKELESMTFDLGDFSTIEAEEIADNIIDIYQVGHDWIAPEEVYSNIFREFIPEAVKDQIPAGKICSTVVAMLDKAKQGSNKTLHDIDNLELKWINEEDELD